MKDYVLFTVIYIICVVLCVMGLIYTHNTITDLGVLILVSVFMIPLIIILKQDDDKDK